MATPTQPSPTDDVTWEGADLLGITLEQLRLWSRHATRGRAMVPKSDERAWDDTEIDVRRMGL